MGTDLRKKQTRRGSLAESLTNYIVGFTLAYLTWLWVVPLLFGIETGPVQSLWVNSLFTGISITRHYILRRLFECFG